jgi:A/G-specific adenine glycosylase
VVETNIIRLFARLFDISAPVDSAAGRNAIWKHAAALVPARRAGDFNSALMDLGSLVCVSPRPKCAVCPVEKQCQADDPARLPVRRPRPALKQLRERHAFTTTRGKVLLQQCRERWRGMWMLPVASSSAKGERAVHVSTFPFTHHRIRLEIFARHGSERDPATQRWFPIRSIESVPVPSPHRRVLTELLAKTNVFPN